VIASITPEPGPPAPRPLYRLAAISDFPLQGFHLCLPRKGDGDENGNGRKRPYDKEQHDTKHGSPARHRAARDPTNSRAIVGAHPRLILPRDFGLARIERLHRGGVHRRLLLGTATAFFVRDRVTLRVCCTA
jgi:hypothetical protein